MDQNHGAEMEALETRDGAYGLTENTYMGPSRRGSSEPGPSELSYPVEPRRPGLRAHRAYRA
jgi:hypothetical protein